MEKIFPHERSTRKRASFLEGSTTWRTGTGGPSRMVAPPIRSAICAIRSHTNPAQMKEYDYDLELLVILFLHISPLSIRKHLSSILTAFLSSFSVSKFRVLVTGCGILGVAILSSRRCRRNPKPDESSCCWCSNSELTSSHKSKMSCGMSAIIRRVLLHQELSIHS